MVTAAIGLYNTIEKHQPLVISCSFFFFRYTVNSNNIASLKAEADQILIHDNKIYYANRTYNRSRQ